jgi:U4/U6.U5 tri-snRNP component SNU23
VINLKTPELGRSPFFCTVCECELRDSANWLAHLNGKNHVRNLGMNLRAERSTLEGVKAKLASTSEKKQDNLTPDEAAAAFRAEFDERVRQQEEDARQERQQKRDSERARKRADREAAEPDQPAAEPVDPMMAAMGFGFGGFASTKQQ